MDFYGFGYPPEEIPDTSMAPPQDERGRATSRSAMTNRDREHLIQIFAIRNRRRTTEIVKEQESPTLGSPTIAPGGEEDLLSFTPLLSLCSQDLSSFVSVITQTEVSKESVQVDEDKPKSFSDELLEAFASSPADFFALPKETVDNEIPDADPLGPFSPRPKEPPQKPRHTARRNAALWNLDENVAVVEHGIAPFIMIGDEVIITSDVGGMPLKFDDVEAGALIEGSPAPYNSDTPPVELTPEEGETDDSGSDTDSDDSDTGTIINVYQSSVDFQDVTQCDDVAGELDNAEDDSGSGSSDNEDSDTATLIFVPKLD